MFKRFLFFLFLSLSAVGSQASAERLDSSQIDIRVLNDAALKDYSNDNVFDYGDRNINVAPSLWSQFWRWFWSLFGDVYKDAASGGVFKYLFILLGCAATIFAVIKLAGMDLKMILTGKSAIVEMPYSESFENIHEMSFDAEIDQALSRNDFRLAVRLLYLKSLKRLNDSGRISWKPEKTNSEYIQELKNPPQKESFALLTRQFEYVWYGNFPVNSVVFDRLKGSFNDFNRGHY